jgi:hypothetical protein
MSAANQKATYNETEGLRKKEIVKMDAAVRALWIVVECPNCHKPQVINRWVEKGVVYDFKTVRSYECDLCDNPYEFHLQVRESLGDPHLVNDSPSPVSGNNK